MSPRYYIIDFDSTLVSVETLEELARIALENDPQRNEKLAHIAEITERGMNGEISFPDSLKARLLLLSLSEYHLERVRDTLMRGVSPSALKNKQWFRERAANIFVISGGFKELILPITNVLGIDPRQVYANTFVIDENRHIVSCNPENLLAQEKGKEKQARALGLTGDIVIIGDGMTDYEMKAAYPQAKFLYFAEHVKRPKVMAVADGILDSFDVLCSAEKKEVRS